MTKRAVISLSGGMDSSSLLLNLLANDYEVKVLSVDYGQKHKIELERAKSLVDYLKQNGAKILSHNVLKLDIGSLLNSNLVDGGEDVPEGHYENENMKATVVPNRNKIFSSIIQAVALSWANEVESEVEIAIGIHAGDHAVYPDCRQEFRDADYEAFLQGNWNGERVQYCTPYLEIDKFGILEDGLESCEKLGVDFNEVYSRTMTSYKPIQDPKSPEKWYADHKSASSVERVEAFINLGRPDPCQYAILEDDNIRILQWHEVIEDVNKVLEEA